MTINVGKTSWYTRKCASSGGGQRPVRFIRAFALITAVLLGFSVLGEAIAQTSQAIPIPRKRPEPPPPSQVVSEADYYRMEDIFKAIDKKKWKKARAAIPNIESDLGRDLLNWHILTRKEAKSSFEDIVGFAEKNSDWPYFNRLLRRAEEAIPKDMPPQQIVSWFAGQEPLTGEGTIRLGEALLAVGQEDYGKFWIERAWINNDFSYSRERAILKAHKVNLSRDAHEKRLNRLLWHRRHTAARRMVPLVGKDHQTLAKARMRLASGASSPSGILSRVPVKLQSDPGLLYDRIYASRRRGQDKATHPLLLKAPQDINLMVRPDRWWVERHLQVRKLHKDRDYRMAYQIARGHGLESGAPFAEAEFLAGWLALRYNNNPERAFEHFDTLEKGVSFPISKSRAFYWKGRAAESAGKIADARTAFSAAATFPYTFYGQLALANPLIGARQLVLPQQAPPRDHLKWAFDDRPLTKAVRLLDEHDRSRTVRAFFYHMSGTTKTPEEFALLGDLAIEMNYTNYSIRVAKKAMQKHIALVEHSYPLLDVPEYTGKGEAPDPALVFGLSRQESEFNAKAVSSAGARGLMQLMPSTAKITARKHGMPYQRSWLTDDPFYNTQLGMAHLSDLLRRFDGSYIMTIASYNAGARRIDQWVKDYGDPRDPKVDPIDWVESIPYRETRNYVQRVLENTQVYRNRLAGQATDLQIRADLKRSSSQLASKTGPQKQARLSP